MWILTRKGKRCDLHDTPLALAGSHSIARLLERANPLKEGNPVRSVNERIDLGELGLSGFLHNLIGSQLVWGDM